jgi:hypothetical protein
MFRFKESGSIHVVMKQPDGTDDFIPAIYKLMAFIIGIFQNLS